MAMSRLVARSILGVIKMENNGLYKLMEILKVKPKLPKTYSPEEYARYLKEMEIYNKNGKKDERR